MDLPSSVVKKFVELTKEPESTTGHYVYGTAIVNGDEKYVQVDGSESLTSVSIATDIATGDRVLLYIENHTASVIGNVTCPASGRGAIDVSDMLQDFETLVVGDLYAITETVETIYANYVSTDYLETYYFTAEYIVGNYLLAASASLTYATIDNLDAEKARITALESSQITTEYLEANYASIIDLDAVRAQIKELDAEYAKIDWVDATFATIEDLLAYEAYIYYLDVDIADIKSLLAGVAGVGELEAIHLTASNVVIEGAIITDAAIAYVSADKITSGTIYTKYVQIADDENKRLWIDGGTIQLIDTNNIVRVQIGEDNLGDYNLYLWDDSGTLIWNPKGLTEEGLTGNGAIIKNAAVDDNAAIAGYKLDIDSVVSELNSNGTLIVNAAHVQVDDNTLDYTLSQIQTQTQGLEGVTTDLMTQLKVVQSDISAKVWLSDINESISDLWAMVDVSIGDVLVEVGSLIDENTKYLESEIARIDVQSDNISVTVEGIKSSVDNIEENYVTKASLVLQINSETGYAELVGDADYIYLYGNQIVIQSDNFSLDMNGNVTANGATIHGDIYAESFYLQDVSFSITSGIYATSIKWGDQYGEYSEYFSIDVDSGLYIDSSSGLIVDGNGFFLGNFFINTLYSFDFLCNTIRSCYLNTLFLDVNHINTDSINVTSSTNLSGSLTVTAWVKISNTLEVSGAVTLSSTLSVSGAVTLSGKLSVSGAVTLSSTLSVSGAVTLSSTLTTSGNIYAGTTSGTSAIYSYCRSSYGSIALYVATDTSRGLRDITTGSWMIAYNTSNVLYIGNTSYQSTLRGSSISITGAVTADSNFTIKKSSGNAVLAFNATGQSRNLQVGIGSAGNKGLYDADNSLWFCYLNTSNYVYVGNASFGRLYLRAQSSVYSSFTVTVDSDIQLKTDISPFNSNYDELFDNLSPVVFRYISGGGKSMGFIYQDVKKALGDANLDEEDHHLISTYEDEEGHTYGGVAYSEIIALLVYEVQNLKQQIKQMQN